MLDRVGDLDYSTALDGRQVTFRVVADRRRIASGSAATGAPFDSAHSRFTSTLVVLSRFSAIAAISRGMLVVAGMTLRNVEVGSVGRLA